MKAARRATAALTLGTLAFMGCAGEIFLSVNYKDGSRKSSSFEQGDGLFWPVDGEPHCNWLDVPEPSKSPSTTLDAYNRP